MNLYEKLLLVTDEVGRIDKTGINSFQKYAYIEQGEVAARVRAALVKHKVFIFPEVVAQNVTAMDKGFHALLDMKFTIVNAETPEERVVLSWWAGEGSDTSDKAVNKAGTAGHKYFLMKLFNISDKDDPDAQTPDLKPKTKPTFIKPAVMSLLRSLMREKDMTGDAASAFVQSILGHPAPLSEAEAETLITELEHL